MLSEAVQPLTGVPLEVLFRTAARRVDAGTVVVVVRGLVGEQFTARVGVQERQPAVRRGLDGEAAVDQVSGPAVPYGQFGVRGGEELSNAPGASGSMAPAEARTRTPWSPQGSMRRISSAVCRSRPPARML